MVGRSGVNVRQRKQQQDHRAYTQTLASSHLYSERGLANRGDPGDSGTQGTHRNDDDARKACQPVDIVDARFCVVLRKVHGGGIGELPRVRGAVRVPWGSGLQDGLCHNACGLS